MIIDLLGVIEDGSVRAPDVPTVVGKQLQFTAGEDVTVRLQVIRPSGAPGDTSSTYTLTIKKRTADGTAIAAAVGVAQPLDGAGRLNFTIPSNSTHEAEPGRYVYDVWRNDGITKQPVITALPVILRPRCLLP
jgi:hypothetical protein